MHNPHFIKTFLQNKTVWPNKEVTVVEVLDPDNSIRKVEVPRSEADLVMFIKLVLTLTDRKMDKLVSLIEDFGQERYEDGYDNCERSQGEVI